MIRKHDCTSPYIWQSKLGLVKELAVGVLAEQSLTHGGTSRVFQELQPGLEGIVDIDLSVSADDDNAASTCVHVSCNFFFSIP